MTWKIPQKHYCSPLPGHDWLYNSISKSHWIDTPFFSTFYIFIGGRGAKLLVLMQGADFVEIAGFTILNLSLLLFNKNQNQTKIRHKVKTFISRI